MRVKNQKLLSQKKRLAHKELRDLRRIITFMVVSGFSLLEVRKLYIDELYDFYEHLMFNLEQRGEVKKGTYAKIKQTDANAEDTVNSLRKQIFSSIANKNKKHGTK